MSYEYRLLNGNRDIFCIGNIGNFGAALFAPIDNSSRIGADNGFFGLQSFYARILNDDDAFICTIVGCRISFRIRRDNAINCICDKIFASTNHRTIRLVGIGFFAQNSTFNRSFCIFSRDGNFAHDLILVLAISGHEREFIDFARFDAVDCTAVSATIAVFSAPFALNG